MRNFVLTSTSVTDGHPDKLCDRMSDAIVDAFLSRDPSSRIIAECAITAGIVFVAAQMLSSAHVDLTAIIRALVAETGYRDPDFNAEDIAILTRVTPKNALYGAAENGTVEIVSTTVFGFACTQTPEMMPLPIALAHRLARQLSERRASSGFEWLHPDGLVQVAVAYENRVPVSIEGITLFSALLPGAPAAPEVASRLRSGAIDPIVQASGVPVGPRCRININPATSQGPGGPGQHAGLTGRKNDIDCYGGYSRHGGAALSGKAPSRIDRSAAYAARYAAKNVVASGLAAECEVQLSYAIGTSAPVSVALDCFGTARVPEERILAALNDTVDFDAEAIVKNFALNDLPRRCAGSFFQRLAAFGHFGRTELDSPWEVTDKAGEIAGRAG